MPKEEKMMGMHYSTMGDGNSSPLKKELMRKSKGKKKGKSKDRMY